MFSPVFTLSMKPKIVADGKVSLNVFANIVERGVWGAIHTFLPLKSGMRFRALSNAPLEKHPFASLFL